MQSESALVASPDGKTLQLRTARQSSCSACSLKGGCGQYLLARQDALLELHSCELGEELRKQGLRAGEQVRISLAEGQLLLLAALFYALPLASLLLATLLAFWLGAGEGAVILAALAGLLSGIALTRQLLRTGRLGRRLSPQIRREPEAADMAARHDGSPQ
jgi:sigma-E factor negative regulatory protein RseC